MGPFPKEGFVVRTLQQKGPTLVAWLSRFKEIYIIWTDLRVMFFRNAVGYALHADEHKDETATTGC